MIENALINLPGFCTPKGFSAGESSRTPAHREPPWGVSPLA